MHDSNRSNEPATLGIFGAISALVLCCFIVGILAYSSGQETERRDKTPAAYNEAAMSKAQKDCAGREGQAAFECIYEKVEASQQQARDEQDLTAQQKSANGTMITAALAFLGLIASVIGIGLVYTTFNETRKANEIARESLIAANRAWLRVTTRTEFSIRFYNDCMAARMCFTVHNIGSSVAKEVKVWAIFQIIGPGDIVGFGKDQLPPPIYIADRNGIAIWPEKEHEFDRNVPGACPALVSIPDGNFQVLMKVVVRYKTIYDTANDEERVTEAIYEVTPDRWAFNNRTFPKNSGEENVVNCSVELISAGGWRIT